MLATLLLLVVVLLCLGFFRTPLLIASGVILLSLLISPLLFHISGLGFFLIAAPVVAALILLNYKPVRQRVISAPLLQVFRKVLPPLSDTEKDAMESGDVWWDAELFSGKPDWNKLLAGPEPELSEREQAFLDGPVQQLCDMLDDWEITHTLKDLTPEAWAYIKKEKFFGMIIPEEYGGLAFSALAHSTVVMKLATRSITAAVTVMVPNSLGPGELIMRYGTQEQKEYFLPRLADGREIPCFALTGPFAGSDAGAMPDTGIVCKGEFGGEEITGIRLNWEKRYITLGPVATLLGLAFKLYDPDHLLGDEEDIGITLALIPTDTPGVSIGRRHNPVDIPFQNGPNSGRDVFIPLDWLIGGREYAGKGWRMLVECLAEGRGVSLPALSTGACKFASRTTGAYAAVRSQFKIPVGKFEGVQEVLGRIGGLAYMADAARTLTLSALDQHIQPAVVTAIVKYHLTESMRRAIDDAMDIHGGRGIMLGPNNYLARVYESIPVAITVEGANILTRNMIIYGQGAIRCHPFVLEEMQAAAGEGDQALQDFDLLLVSHAGFFFGNLSRSLILGLSGARLTSSPVAGPVAHYYRQLERMSAVLAMASDASMALLGGQLKRRENVSARLGDVLSYLYLASATLKRYQDQDCAEQDLPLVRWVCDHCLQQMQSSLDQLFANYPNRIAGQVLRLVSFPLGMRFRAPSDESARQIAALLMTPSDARDRLTANIFIPDADGEIIARLERALALSPRVQALEKRLHSVIRAGDLKIAPGEDLYQVALDRGLLSTEEKQLLDEAAPLIRAVIDVDDFAPDEF